VAGTGIELGGGALGDAGREELGSSAGKEERSFHFDIHCRSLPCEAGAHDPEAVGGDPGGGGRGDAEQRTSPYYIFYYYIKFKYNL
jgi:hypothetical protein